MCVKRIFFDLFQVFVDCIRMSIIISAIFRFVVSDAHCSVAQYRERAKVVFIRRLFPIRNAGCAAMSPRHLNGRREEAVTQVMGHYQIRLCRFRVFCNSFYPVCRNGTITNYCGQINYDLMSDPCSAYYRWYRFNRVDVRFPYFQVRCMNSVAFSIQYLANSNCSWVILYRSFSDGVVFGGHCVQVLLCNSGRTILGFNTNVVFVIRSAGLQVASFPIGVRLSFFIFVRICAPASRFLCLYKDFACSFFCDNAIASPIANGRYVFGVFFGVICRRVNR